MPSLAFHPFSTRSIAEASSSIQGCPTTTVTPDAHGWVPPGTCGYLSRPYCKCNIRRARETHTDSIFPSFVDPSFIAALVFSIIAAGILLGYVRIVIRAARRRALPENSALPWSNGLLLPCFGTLISTCLLAAYVLRVFGTRYQQVPVFVAFSDTLILICPICE
jgi:hypothetical protein